MARGINHYKPMQWAVLTTDSFNKNGILTVNDVMIIIIIIIVVAAAAAGVALVLGRWWGLWCSGGVDGRGNCGDAGGDTSNGGGGGVGSGGGSGVGAVVGWWSSGGVVGGWKLR